MSRFNYPATMCNGPTCPGPVPLGGQAPPWQPHLGDTQLVPGLKGCADHYPYMAGGSPMPVYPLSGYDWPGLSYDMGYGDGTFLASVYSLLPYEGQVNIPTFSNGNYYGPAFWGMNP